MQTLGEAAEAAAEAVEQAREADRVQLAEAAKLAGGAKKWLLQAAPAVEKNCPEDLSDDELTAETSAFYAGAEERLRLCRRCPTTGGACDGDPSGVTPGEQPRWQDRRLVLAPCDRWREHRIRKRLIAAGVPPVSASATLGSYPGDASAVDGCVAFIENAVRMQTAWIILQGPHQSGKTHLSVATLRNLKTFRPRLQLHYVNASRIEASLKAFYDNSSELTDPLEAFRSADVAVLDNFNPKQLPAWLQSRLAAALVVRSDEGRSTIITTRSDNMKPVFGALSELAGLPAVARLKLRRALEDES